VVVSLEVVGLKKSFKDKLILKDINFKVGGSEILGIIGKSGCGKTTLLKILAGYYKQDKGKIVLNTSDISKNIKLLRKLVGYTTQENSFYEKLSILENMRYYSNLYDVSFKERKKRIDDILEQVNLLGHKKKLAENISGGMKRRLDFAISLIHNPSILILDEPTTGLDPLLIDQFWQIVKEVVKEENKMAIVSSHILSEIEKYCTKIAIMDQGKIIKVFDKKKVKNLESEFRKLLG